MLWTCLSPPPQATTAVVVQDILMSSNICELDEGLGGTGEHSIRQAIKQLSLWCQGANLEKGGWKEELLAASPDGGREVWGG